MGRRVPLFRSFLVASSYNDNPIRCVFEVWYWTWFKCLSWPCPVRFIFSFLRHQSWHFVFLRPETRAVTMRVSGSKWIQSTELDVVNRSLCNLCALALGLGLHIFATQCWWVPTRTKQLSTVAILLYWFLSCLLSQNALHVVSALQFIVLAITTTLPSLNSYHIFSDTKAALFLFYIRTTFYQNRAYSFYEW